MISVEPKNFEQVREALDKLTPAVKDAIRETIRKTIPWVENEAVELITRRYHISRGDLMNPGRHGKWKFTPKYPSGEDLKGGVEVEGSRMPVMKFQVKPREVPPQMGIPVAARTRISIRTVKWGRAQVGKPNVFLAQMKSGHIGVYKRKIPNPGGPRQKRDDGQWTQLPITEEYMISVPEMLASKKIRTKLEDSMSKYAQGELRKELEKVPRKEWARKAALKNLF